MMDTPRQESQAQPTPPGSAQNPQADARPPLRIGPESDPPDPARLAALIMLAEVQIDSLRRKVHAERAEKAKL